MKIKANEIIYLAMNKPRGYVCATKDNLHQVVTDLVQEKVKGLHIVGRLDKDTTGLLILTNDGNYTHMATHPKKHVSKTYEVTLKEKAKKSYIDEIAKGMTIDLGKTQLKPGVLKIVSDKIVRLQIHEGKFHQVKKMMFTLGNEVVELHRIEFDGILLEDLNIDLGEYKKIQIQK